MLEKKTYYKADINHDDTYLAILQLETHIHRLLLKNFYIRANGPNLSLQK